MTIPTPVRQLRLVTAPSTARVGLSEVLSALSHALDLTEGQPLGHTVRSCLIGMRIAEQIGLPPADRSALYYAVLLKDAGCSSNAARMASLFGADDRAVKPRMKLVDWHRRVVLAIETARSAGLGGSILDRVRQFVSIARSENVTRDLIALRCERGADIARQLGFPPATSQAIRSLDEHWCGLGYPEGLAGEAIPLLSRIANVAQTAEAVNATHGPEEAIGVLRERRGSWFDPELVDVVASWRNDRAWWRRLITDDVAALVVAAEPAGRERLVDDDELDAVARAFADIIDAKSPYTYRHSAQVAHYARLVSRALGDDADEQRRMHRAGLLHDIGKLGVSNRILDKPGALTAAERQEVERHPKYTLSILSRVGAFGAFAWTAALHHEKLDGTGYPWGLGARQLDRSARILAVVDVYEALTSDRPYRAGMTHEKTLGILRGDATAGKVAAEIVEVLASVAPGAER